MLRIQRSSDKVAVFALSGRIDTEGLLEMQRVIGLEAAGQDITIDLQDITLVDREAVKFLANCELKGIKLENCPAFIREWIDTESGGGNGQKG
jgi:ABC-type transporter Mla MlaB component